MSKILVTGATGFIGKRLIYRLLEAGHEVYALSHIKGARWNLEGNPKFHIIYGDLRDFSTIDPFPDDLDAAYYLVHSMSKIMTELVETEVLVAQNFLKRVEMTSCRQIVYLGGIIESEESLSPHLQSRLAVERVLQSSSIPHTILRASIIIGEGSASFEIIRDLTEKLPIMIAPQWVHSYCQPIAIRDVLFYLVAVLFHSSCLGKTFDIGGPEALTFQDVLLRYAKLRGLKRKIFVVPVLTPKLSSYWLLLITSVSYSICSHLVESMKQNTRKLNRSLDAIVPHACLTYEEALQRSFDKIAQNEVLSNWMDALDFKQTVVDLQNYIEVPVKGCFKDSRVREFKGSPEDVRKRIWAIGGSQGWYSMAWAWRLRGFLDQLFGGRGLNLRRVNAMTLQAGDTIDFWRVVLADQQHMHLILYAEMKMPGEAWLEFRVNSENKQLLIQATFRPKGLLGRLYWYVLLPFHAIIFESMARKLTHA